MNYEKCLLFHCHYILMSLYLFLFDVDKYNTWFPEILVEASFFLLKLLYTLKLKCSGCVDNLHPLRSFQGDQMHHGDPLNPKPGKQRKKKF